MKTRLLISTILLGLIAFAFVFKNMAVLKNETITLPTAQNAWLDRFYTGAMDDDADRLYNPGFSQLDMLGFNLWHQYCDGIYNTAEQRWHPVMNWGRTVFNDNLLEPVSNYSSGVGNIMSGIYSHNERRLIMMRPKITWLCYGQSSIYECEDTTLTDDDLWFYTFQQRNGQSERDYQYGNGQWVLYCGLPTDGANPHYIVQRLKANTEQSHRMINNNFTETSYNNEWYGDSYNDWLIKPRIRIDQNFANNPANWDMLVCRVDVYNQDGYNQQNPEQNKIKSIDIRVRNFRQDQFTNYDGYYKEEFNFGSPWNDTSTNYRHGDWAVNDDGWVCNARGNRSTDTDNNKADIQVYWYDNCYMWIDYIKVENDVADRLLKGYYDNALDPEHQWIKQEAEQIGCYSINGGYPVMKFYLELSEFNNIPCMAYVNQKLKDYSSAYTNGAHTVDLMQDMQYWALALHVPLDEMYTVYNAEVLKSKYIQKAGFTQVFAECYPLNACCSGTQYSEIPTTLPTHSGNNILATATSPNQYELYLQNTLNYYPSFLENGGNWGLHCVTNGGATPQNPGFFRNTMQICNALSKSCNIPFIFMPQAHQWYSCGENHREPANEELDMMANVSATYGARGLLYFMYPSFNYPSSNKYPPLKKPLTTGNYGVGITTDWGGSLITANFYGESRPKWEVFRDISDRMQNKWGDYLLTFDNADRYSFDCANDNERYSLRTNTYINNVVSYKPGYANPDCWNDLSNKNILPSDGLIFECPEYNYVQAATFNTTPGFTQYFMIVNRRCSPFIDESTADNRGGKRWMRIWFNQNSSFFPTYNSWKITDVADPWTAPIRFDKSSVFPVNLGWFSPGEGRLYKIEAVPPKGGTLVADEVIDGNITIEDTVFTNGYNITVENNSHISFTDSSCFVIQGGSFTMGNAQYSGSPNINCDAVSGNSWSGFVFDSCEVRIYNSTFSGFTSDTSYPLNMIDCPLIDIRNNTFSNNENSTLGAVNVTYYNIDEIENVYIGSNTFELTNSVVPNVNILSYAGITTPLIIENNIFSSNTDNSTAILLSGITGGAVKNNTITNFATGLNLLSSSIDVSENTISSNLESSVGILAVSGSEIKMNPSGELQLGGMNNISCTGSNIKLDNGYFNMDYGENIFNINDAYNYSHLSGWFPMFVAATTYARENCFKVSNVPYTPPVENLTWGENGSDIDFTFNPYLTGCEPDQCTEYVIIDLGGGLYDTVCMGNGNGMGMLEKDKIPLLGSDGVGSTASSPGNASTESMHSKNSIILSPKQAYDSLCIYIRYRNYAQAKNKCYELLNNYPDSIQSINAINKLFLSITASDTTQLTVSQLKIYFEGLILNHPNNVSLVNRCNYFVQKCKVKMRDYTSALTGFQQIINQNPASYEGLVARWDYMATSLLMHGGGTGGISDLGTEISDYNSLESDEFEKFDESYNDDGPFTREEKKVIHTAVNDALNTSRTNNERKIEILKERYDLGDVHAKRELERVNKMKEVVKTQRPKNIIEHIKIINSDIQKIFGGKSSNNKSPLNNIPVVYRLAQNYPNPFNPVTTIKYEIPIDSKVKLVVYDLLGREVKALVNNEIKSAGYYKVEFNMQNYASGVYFYRIEADDTKGNKFIDAKKMVLVK